MPPAIAVATIHGVGPTKAGYSQRFQQQVQAHLAGQGIEADAVHFEEIRWAGLLDGKHRDLLHRMEGAGRLRHRSMRKFVIAAVGESGAYREVGTSGHALYEEVHDAIRDGLARAQEVAGDVPLVLVSHSLGTVIASDHVWDEQLGRGRGRTSFQRCHTLAGLVTLGSPLPLYTLAHRRIQAIRFPGAGVDPAVRPHCRWLNLYDPDDVLGWPLRPTAHAYAQVVAEDRRINVGGPLSFWNPLSHLGYWDDGTVHKAVAAHLRTLVEAARASPLVRLSGRRTLEKQEHVVA